MHSNYVIQAQYSDVPATFFVIVYLNIYKVWNFIFKYNVFKYNNAPWVFFTFFKLYEWYQIAQGITYNENKKSWGTLRKTFCVFNGIWDKVFKSGLSKKFFKVYLPQNLLSPLLNNFAHLSGTERVGRGQALGRWNAKPFWRKYFLSIIWIIYEQNEQTTNINKIILWKTIWNNY